MRRNNNTLLTSKNKIKIFVHITLKIKFKRPGHIINVVRVVRVHRMNRRKPKFMADSAGGKHQAKFSMGMRYIKL